MTAAAVHDQAAWIRGGSAACTTSLPQAPVRTWRLVFLGAPGTGKGTQAELLSRRLSACHLSTGDVFRAIRNSHCEKTPAMQQALEQMNSGELVSDETVLAVIRERAGCLKCNYGFILDGFPRTLTQAQQLDEMFAELGIALDAVIDFTLPAEQIIARLSGRRTCPQCRESCHLVSHPPRVAGRCDACGAALIQREDDRPEAIAVRLQVYGECTAALEDYYRRRGQLISVPAGGPPEQVHEMVVQELAGR